MSEAVQKQGGTATLPTIVIEKPWGVDRLPEPFVVPPGKRVGEVWFDPPAALSELLVKYLFTSEKLSVQVHPDDEGAMAAGLGRQGKSECWYVVDAEPGARLGIGFTAGMDADTMRAAALDGSIEQAMAWYEPKPGDFFYIPAGTVHAIGAGVRLIEVQQNSDITYRLYDYGRPRELHLDAAVAVARGEAFDTAMYRRVPATGTVRLVNGPHFVLDRVEGPLPAALVADYAGPLLAIPVIGTSHAVGKPVVPGECALIEDIATLTIDEGALCLLTRPSPQG